MPVVRTPVTVCKSDLTLAKEDVAKVFRLEKPETHCKCCGRLIKAYYRSLSSSMTLFLILVVRRYRELYANTHVHEHGNSGGGDFAKLEKWGLIKAVPNTDVNKKDSGKWLPTQLGLDFADKKVAVPAKVILIDNRIIKWDTKRIFIEEALGKKYSYSELMSGVIPRMR